MDEVTKCEQQIRAEMARAKQIKASLDPTRSDTEIRAFQQDSVIRSGERQLAALNAFGHGERSWPDEG